MSNPLVSIIVPAYNYGRYLGHCIDSVVEQTYPNWELLVVNNGSTDNTSEVIDRYSDSRIKKFRIETNDGITKALKLGYDQSAGEYIGFLAADDMFTPFKLERQIKFLRLHPDVNCLGTYVEVIDDQGRVSRNNQGVMSYVNEQFDFADLKTWRWKHFLCMPTVIYSKYLCDKIGMAPSDGLTNVFDWDFHVRLLRAGACFKVIPEKLTHYRWHDSNETRRRQNVQNQWIYSFTRSFVPVIREFAPDPHREMADWMKAIYLDTLPNLFMEEATAGARRAYLEAMLDPEDNVAQCADYQSFRRYTMEWQVNSDKRAAIAALDESLMELRARLLSVPSADRSKRFPLERIAGARMRFADRVRLELQRGIRRVRKSLGLGDPAKQAA